MTPRMRTAEGAVKIIKEEDPDTALTVCAVRRMIKRGEISYFPVGNKKLISVDELLRKLQVEAD